MRAESLPPVAAVVSFIDAINRGDVDRLGQLMTADHHLDVFDEPPLRGRDANIDAWHGYTEAFPRYVIHPERIVERDRVVTVLGFTTGSHLGLSDDEERAARVIWRASVDDGRLASWQLIDDTVSLEFDHVVIHIDDWIVCNRFYSEVLGIDIVNNPEGAGNPLGAVAYRVGDQQINVHGPWPGMVTPCCPPPLDEIGRADLAFRTARTAEENLAHLDAFGVTVTAGPMRRFGARGWGTSVYCCDPSGNGIELIAYDP